MGQNSGEIAASAVVLSVVGYAMWPWRGGDVWKWFMHLPEPLQGDLEVLAIAMLLTAVVGVLMRTIGGIQLSNLAIGGILAYAFWMTVLTAFFELHDPVPYVVYGQVLLGVFLGAIAETLLERQSDFGNRVRS